MKNVLFALLFIIIVIAAIFGIPAAMKQVLGVDEPMMTVISGSMWPHLSRGDIVIVEKTTTDEIKVGTVIVFRHQNGLAVHRVVSLDVFTLTTKGDANPLPDDPILYSDVVGRVPAIGSWLVKIPWVGNFALIANPEAGASEPGQTAQVDFWEQLGRTIISPIGFIIVIVFPLVLIFQSQISDAINRIMPTSSRKRRLQKRARRLRARWGEERTRRILRM